MLIPILILLAIPLFLIAFVLGSFVWHHVSTKGLAYFGRPRAEREQFKKKLARLGRVLRPLLRPLGSRLSDPNQFASAYHGIYVPGNSCNEVSLERAVQYAPQPNDIFVVTQMKCGTTWMQQLVYETLSRGRGDLSDEGHGHMAAVSPWLESFNGVSVDDAPLVGAAQARIIKTHLPASLCPYHQNAKYIYVTRHPVSAFRSCVDFFHANAGPLTPPEDALLNWYCNDRMWWGSWPDHVDGFWRRAQERSNVAFFHFEELTQDLPAAIRRLARFLDYELTDEELALVAEKGSFSYMKAHEAQFEMMIPPSFFSAEATFFKSGSARRHEEVEATQTERIGAFCRNELDGGAYPLARFYPDVAAG